MRPIFPLHRRLLLLTCLGAWARGVHAALAAPRERVVLSLSGRISLRNRGDEADFDLDMIAALPQHSFQTRTPWDKLPRKFSGPLLRELLNAVGAQGRTLQAVALNDYKVMIPVEDAQRFDVIVCHRVDDQPMRVRDRGPLFIVYPFDSHTELQNPRYFSRSIWQLRRLDVQ